MRWVVVLSRMGFGENPDSPLEVEAFYDSALIGPFRERERADRRADVIRRLADTYEDPEGVTGADNALQVTVRPILPGTASARDALYALYDL